MWHTEMLPASSLSTSPFPFPSPPSPFPSPSSPSPSSVPSHQWTVRYRRWRGFVQRDASMNSPLLAPVTPAASAFAATAALDSSQSLQTSGEFSSLSAAGAINEKLKPHIFLLHGFGGSLDQFTEMAKG